MSKGCGMLVVGSRAATPASLEELVRRLPRRFPMTVAVVSRCHAATRRLAVPLPVAEVDDKDPALPGRLYLAPPDYHLLVEERGFALSTDPPVFDARPSIDVLFRSAAEAHGERAVGVLLGNGGRDGREGLAAIREHGGAVLAEADVVEDSPELVGIGRLPSRRIAELLLELAERTGAP